MPLATQPRPPLTPRQREVYDFIRSETRRRGFAPTVREVGKALGLPYTNGVICHLRALERKGFIRHEGGLSRSITVVEAAGDGEGARVLRLLAGMAWPLPSGPPGDASHAIYLSADELATLRRVAGLGEGDR